MDPAPSTGSGSTSARSGSPPQISLVTTVRDGALYLAQALESALAQTFADWELVLWDDGSTDDTLAIARAFAARDARIRVISAPARGRRLALTAAHAETRGAYLAWLDADDWLAPEALARTHAAITASPGCALVYTDHVVVDPDGARRGPSRRQTIPYSPHRLLIDFMTFHFRLFRRDAFERAGGIAPDRDIAIDYDLCLRIAEHGRLEHLAEPLYFYRVHDAQMSSRERAAQIAASAAAIHAAVARRGLTRFALDVDLAVARFRLVHRPPRVASWRLALATAFPRLREPPVRDAPCVIGTWPGRDARLDPDVDPDAARGARFVSLGRTLAALVRAVWTGRAGDELRIHDLSPLFTGRDDGAVLGACLLFLATIDHARARRTRIVWHANEAPTSHEVPASSHAAREAWCRRAFASRCDAIVTDPRELPRGLGVPATRIELATRARRLESHRIARLLERRPVPGTQPISVVIPIRDRAGSDLRNSLASLAWQRGGRPWETIVVSHGSTPSIDAELRTLARDAGATLVAIGSPADAWNKPLALNTGIRATDPAIPFVMTMDGDMILADDLLETALAQLRADGDTIVLCQSSDLPEGCELPADPVELRARFAELRGRTVTRAKYGTGGIQATRRSFLVEARGYDEDMLWWGALDTDLVRRAEAAGMRAVWLTDRTAMLHQWHPRKHRVLADADRAISARGAWDRNQELLAQRDGLIVRNPRGWGASLDQGEPEPRTATSARSK